jgi:hypothetical protein
MAKPNWGGGLSGAASGAGIGSMFGPVGTGIGAGIGGLIGMFGGGGKQDEFKQVNRFSPEQQKAFQEYWNNPITQQPGYQAGNQYIQNLLSGNPEAYAAFEAPLMRQFKEQTVPGIAERFAGMGTGAGAGGSSALYNSLAKAGSDFSTNIAALRGNMQMQALPQALQYAQQPYSNALGGFGVSPFENVMMQGQPGVGDYFGQIAPYALQAGMQNGWGFKGGSAPGSPSPNNWGSIPSWANNSPGGGMSNMGRMNQFGFTYG